MLMDQGTRLGRGTRQAARATIPNNCDAGQSAKPTGPDEEGSSSAVESPPLLPELLSIIMRQLASRGQNYTLLEFMLANKTCCELGWPHLLRELRFVSRDSDPNGLEPPCGFTARRLLRFEAVLTSSRANMIKSLAIGSRDPQLHECGVSLLRKSAANLESLALLPGEMPDPQLLANGLLKVNRIVIYTELSIGGKSLSEGDLILPKNVKRVVVVFSGFGGFFSQAILSALHHAASLEEWHLIRPHKPPMFSGRAIADRLASRPDLARLLKSMDLSLGSAAEIFATPGLLLPKLESLNLHLGPDSEQVGLPQSTQDAIAQLALPPSVRRIHLDCRKNSLGLPHVIQAMSRLPILDSWSLHAQFTDVSSLRANPLVASKLCSVSLDAVTLLGLGDGLAPSQITTIDIKHSRGFHAKPTLPIFPPTLKSAAVQWLLFNEHGFRFLLTALDAVPGFKRWTLHAENSDTDLRELDSFPKLVSKITRLSVDSEALRVLTAAKVSRCWHSLTELEMRASIVPASLFSEFWNSSGLESLKTLALSGPNRDALFCSTLRLGDLAHCPAKQLVLRKVLPSLHIFEFLEMKRALDTLALEKIVVEAWNGTEWGTEMGKAERRFWQSLPNVVWRYSPSEDDKMWWSE